MVQMVTVVLEVIEICALYKFLIHNIRFMGKKIRLQLSTGGFLFDGRRS